MYDLDKALKRHAPNDESEAQAIRQIRKFLTQTDNAFDRSNLYGHITGSALLLSRDYNRVLLNHHAKLNIWMCFGGHCDGDSDTRAVAGRETREEAGITAFTQIGDIFDVDVHEIPENISKGEPAHYHFDICYLLACTGDETPVISDESHALRWCDYTRARALTDDWRTLRMLEKWAYKHAA
jgi:8-oxo-dGTP pyrophosphatase MutT (NUDIX family)